MRTSIVDGSLSRYKKELDHTLTQLTGLISSATPLV